MYERLSIHLSISKIHTNELEIKDTAKRSTSASYLNALLKVDANCKLTIQLDHKRGDFDLSILNFPYLCSDIPSHLHANGVYISQLTRYDKTCSTYDQFPSRDSLLTKKLMPQGFCSLVYRQDSANFTVVIMIDFVNTSCH
jgi:hypothetical protein